MTIVWIILWVVVAAGVLGYLGWSANILMAQKKAWSEFAARYKLEVTKGARLMSPVSLSGAINNRRLNVYSVTERSERERMERVYTHIEVFLNAPPNFMMVLSRKTLPATMANLTLPQVLTLPECRVAQTDNQTAFLAWLNPARQATLKNFMSAGDKDTEMMLVCDSAQGFLLWRTEDPMRDPKKLNALAQKLFTFAKEFDAADAGITAKPKPSSESVPPSTTA